MGGRLIADEDLLWRAYPHTLAAKLSGGAYQTPPHVKVISAAIADAVHDGGGLLLIEAPPRHSKSETVSRWAPVWFLAQYPWRHVVLGSYSGDLAVSNGRDVRNRISEHGQKLELTMADDSTAAGMWHTNRGGSCRSVGVGGSLTGFGGHLMILDDLLKDAEEAESEVMRKKIIDWFQSVAWTRREPGCVVVVMATRWHEADLTGWILAHPELSKIARRIRLPAIAEADDILGRPEGAPLWPERFDLESLRGARMGLDERWWNALYQQRPGSAEGAEIKRAWWRYYDELPVPADAMELRALSVDATFKDSKKSDYVCIGAFGVYGHQRYGLDCVHEQMGFVATVKAILTMAEKHKPHVVIVEAKANGDAIIEALQLEGIANIVPISPKASKEARARAASPQIEAGNVYLPRNVRWAQELVEEAAAFPLGKHDDYVDMISQLLNYLGTMRSTPLHHLQGGDNTFVPPHLSAERRSNNEWRSVFDRVRRSV